LSAGKIQAFQRAQDDEDEDEKEKERRAREVENGGSGFRLIDLMISRVNELN